jgi:hypothetical protein
MGHSHAAVRLVAMLVILAVTGCTAMHRVPVVPSTTAAPPTVSPGDEVRLTLRGGHSVRLTVERLEPGAIIARGGERYALADVTSLERREFSAPKTTLLIVAIPVGLLLFAFLAFAIEGK